MAKMDAIWADLVLKEKERREKEKEALEAEFGAETKEVKEHPVMEKIRGAQSFAELESILIEHGLAKPAGSRYGSNVKFMKKPTNWSSNYHGWEDPRLGKVQTISHSHTHRRNPHTKELESRGDYEARQGGDHKMFPDSPF